MGLCRSGTPTANRKDPYKSVHPMPAGDKGPEETRHLLRGAGLRADLVLPTHTAWEPFPRIRV